MRVRALSEREFLDAGEWWDALLVRSRASTFFLRHVWLATWWKHYGAARELAVLVVEDGGTVIGVAPFCVTRETENGVLPVRELAFLGREGATSDYLDLFAEPGRESEVLGAVVRHLLADRSWDLLRVSDVLETSPTLGAMLELGTARGLTSVPGKSQLCPYLPLPATWDAFLASVSGNLRSNLRRREKKLASLGAVIEEAHGDAIAPALEELFSLHGARWETRGKTGNFVDPRARAFHHELAPLLDREGALGLYTCRFGGKPAAAIYGFRGGKTFHYFQAGFDPAFAEHGVGLAIMGHAIRDSIARGMTEFDYLRGDEEYKRRWTSLARNTRTLVFARPSIKGLMWRGLQSSKETAKRLLKRVPVATTAPAPAPAATQPAASVAAPE